MQDDKFDEKLIDFWENDEEILRLRNKMEECWNAGDLKMFKETLIEYGVHIQAETTRLVSALCSNPTYIQFLPH
jgi:hypothetical protein